MGVADVTRAHLANRRAGDSFEVRHGGSVFRVVVGLYEDGYPGEVFVSMTGARGSKPSGDVEALTRDAAILISLAIQHGAPLAVLRAAVTRGGGGRRAGVAGRGGARRGDGGAGMIPESTAGMTPPHEWEVLEAVAGRRVVPWGGWVGVCPEFLEERGLCTGWPRYAATEAGLAALRERS